MQSYHSRRLTDKIEVEIRLHLARRNMLFYIFTSFGKIEIHEKLQQWYNLSWEEFVHELGLEGITFKGQKEISLWMDTFEEQKEKVLVLTNELERFHEIEKSIY
ncbi:MAG: hypothetical protein ACJ75J_10890 [Cytophagaceae bacterium]